MKRSEALEKIEDVKLDNTIEELIKDNPDVTGAAFQLICTKKALDVYWNRGEK